MTTRHTIVDTTLGEITIVATGETITGLYFAHHVRRPSAEAFGPGIATQDDELLGEAAWQLIGYLNGTRRSFDLPLAATGSAFQQAVWTQVGEIPFGRTTTYGAIAAALGDPRRAYEVGQAVGANPLCIVVPCHRVLGSSGALTGYAGGLERKRALLELEAPAAQSAGRLF
jgi:methylated-DNA-[protein]-cysteine S-methyltransferase